MNLFFYTFLSSINSFYQHLEGSNFKMECTSCEDSSSHEAMEEIINTLFKIWYAFDIMQSIQIAISEDDPVCFAILKDILITLEKNIKYKKEILDHPEQLKIIKTLLNHIKSHSVGNYTPLFNRSLLAYSLVFESTNEENIKS